MTKAEDNQYPYVTLKEQASTPATPASGLAKLYRKSDNKQYVLDDGGTETEVGGAGGGGGSAAYAEFTISVPSGSNDGLVTLGARTVVSDASSLVSSYSAGVFTLAAAGNYAVQAVLAYSGVTINSGRHFLAVNRDGSTNCLARANPQNGVSEDTFSVTCAPAHYATSIGIQYLRGTMSTSAAPTLRVVITKLP